MNHAYVKVVYSAEDMGLGTYTYFYICFQDVCMQDVETGIAFESPHEEGLGPWAPAETPCSLQNPDFMSRSCNKLCKGINNTSLNAKVHTIFS